MAADSPKRHAIHMSKKVRPGRIYLDYLRNDLTSTAVAPLSPRARADAPISMPLTWWQVTANLDPARYTLRTVPSLLRKSKPWADYCEAERPLAEAIERLGTRRACSPLSGCLAPRTASPMARAGMARPCFAGVPTSGRAVHTGQIPRPQWRFDMYVRSLGSISRAAANPLNARHPLLVE